MKILALLILFSLIISGSLLADQPLSIEEQTEIIENYLLVTGQTKGQTDASSLETSHDSHSTPIKCGTPAIVQFLSNRDKLDDNLLQALGVAEIDRPVLDTYFDSEGGHFRIHYDTSGVNKVHKATYVNADGVPVFIDSIAIAADSVWEVLINQIGYPAPIVDTVCTNDDNPRVDIYVSNLSGVYGQTHFDLNCVEGTNLMRVPAFMQIDNDFEFIFWSYPTSPSDTAISAAKVTIAHEFFHVIQGGMDFTEFVSLKSGLGNRYWGEMSAVWIEEKMYDEVNDYYNYLPAFFNNPNTSFQQFKTTVSDLHPYGSVVFPLFLSQKYGDEIIHLIWEKQAALGVGPDFLEATAFIIDSLTDGDDSYVTAFSEFALWNFFTNHRSVFAPAGIGYEEAFNYPLFSDEKIMVYDSVPVDMVTVQRNPFPPEHNAISIIRFENTQLVKEDRFYNCVDSLKYYNPICDEDSTVAVEVTDSIDIIDQIYDVIDSSFTISGAYESMSVTNNGVTDLIDWSVSLIFQLTNDSVEIDRLYLPSLECSSNFCLTQFILNIDRVNQYKRIILIMAPASPYESLYDEGPDIDFAYAIRELMSGDTALAPIDEGFSVHPGQLIIYPNPAVVAEMTGDLLRFNIDSMEVFGDPFVGSDSVRVRTVLNMFDIAGNIVYSVDVTFNDSHWEFYGAGSGPLEGIAWDMKNQAGKPVASGIYIAIVEIYIDSKKFSEGVGKVAIIR